MAGFWRSKRVDTDDLAGDIALVRAWKDGDLDAGRLLLERNRAVLERYLGKWRDGDVEDLVQRVHLACRESVDRYNGTQRYQGYMIGIARNVLFETFREERKRADHASQHTSEEEGSAGTPSAVVRSEQVRQLLARVLEQLTEGQREVVQLYFFEERTLMEIAVELGVPLGTVKSRKREAQRKLRDLLASVGITREQIQLTLVGFDDDV